MNLKSIKWWEVQRIKFNGCTILAMILCFIPMKLLNSASVNFFMLPVVLVYLLILNLMYTVCYLILGTGKNDNRFNGILFRYLLLVMLFLHIISGLYLVLTIRHH